MSDRVGGPTTAARDAPCIAGRVAGSTLTVSDRTPAVPLLRNNYTEVPGQRTGSSGPRGNLDIRRKERGTVGFDDLRIRDLSHLAGEWTPPIGAMGGPPAHELYTDLVVFAGLQLYRDSRSRAVVVLRDGAQRRAFLVPCPELRSALDRFRMRRNLRPLPDSAIEEFVRIVVARVSDPDVAIPVLRSPMIERVTEPLPSAPPAALSRPIPPRWKELDHQIDQAIHDLDELEPQHGPLTEETGARSATFPAPPEGPKGTEPEGSSGPRERIDPSLSGGRKLGSGPDGKLGRYLGVLHELTRDGGWMGTTRELARLTRDDPLTLFDSLLRYRPELAAHHLLVTNVEVEDGYRWLAVDRTKIRGSSSEDPSAEESLLAR